MLHIRVADLHLTLLMCSFITTMKILIVEDNATLRRLIRNALDGLTATFVESTDGAEALSAYEVNRPDLVLMDIRMPRLDGLTATRELMQRHPEARVLMLTDYDEAGMRRAAFEAGACGYALKHDLSDLGSIVDRMYRQA
jgi:two-component system response regulator DegU